jgi:hypothetical protein
MVPVPPHEMAGNNQSLWPASAQNVSGANRDRTRATLAIPPQVSFTPTIFGWRPSFSRISELQSRPEETPGKL